jgi:hypothetical protein
MVYVEETFCHKQEFFKIYLLEEYFRAACYECMCKK